MAGSLICFSLVQQLNINYIPYQSSGQIIRCCAKQPSLLLKNAWYVLFSFFSYGKCICVCIWICQIRKFSLHFFSFFLEFNYILEVNEILERLREMWYLSAWFMTTENLQYGSVMLRWRAQKPKEGLCLNTCAIPYES